MNAHSASPWRLRSAALLLAAPLLLLSACNMKAVPSPAARAPSSQPPSTAVPTPPDAPSTALRPLGLMRITFSNIGSSDAAVRAEPAAAGVTPQGITSVGGIQLQPVSTGSFVLGTRGAGGIRYLYATFKVRNASAAGAAYTTNRTNLTLLAVGTLGADGMTALSSVKKFDSTPADPAVAPTILPSHGMTLDRATDQATLLGGAEDLQVYSEAEAASLPLPSGVTRVFPYGFVVRNPATPSSRTLSANPATGQFDGVVTLAMKLPLQPSATSDPFSFSLNVEAVDDSVTRVTESPEEQGAGSSAAARATLLGAGTQVATLCGSSYSGSNDVFVGSATTAGGAGLDRRAHIGGNLALSGPLPSYAVFGNTSASVAASSGLLSNYRAYPPTSGGTAATLSAASSPGTTPGSTLNLSSDGSFGFTPKAGDGSGSTDTIGYTVSDGAGCTSPALLASVPVTGRVWYAKNDAPAGGDGRSDTPFQSLASVAAASSVGDTLYVSRGDGTSANQSSGLTLKANQRLIGSGAALTLGAATLRPADPGGAPLLGNASGDAVTLATDNALSGVSITANGGAGLKGSNFGTLTSSAVSVSAAGGPALDLSSGAVLGSLDSLTSTNSAATGVNLNALNGSLSINGGSISGAAGNAFNVSGGSVNVTDSGTITQGNNAALLNVSSKHSGTLNFNGALSATNGSGLQFNDADGSYNVNAAGSSLTLNGGNAGLSITGGSSGTFNFASSAGSASLTNPSGAAITVTGSNPNLTYGGSITKTNGSGGMVITGNTGGTLTFSGASKQISSTGSDVPVNLTNNTGTTVNFTNGGLALSSGAGTGLSAVGGGTLSVTGPNNTVTTTGTAPNAVNLNGMTIGAGGVNLSSINASGLTTGSAFRATSVGGGAFTAGSLTVAGTTGATSRGLELTSNSAPFTFTTASVNGTGGEGIYLASNTGAVSINGGTVGNTSNTVGDALYVSGGNAAVTVAPSLSKSSAGRVANITGRTGNTTLSGNISCTSACTGISVTSNMGGTHTFAGTTKTLNAAVTLTNNTGANVAFSNGGLAITTTTGNGLNATGGGALTVEGANNTLSSVGGTALNVQNTTIGTGGLNFKSINANGGANGIVLTNTGTTAGLTVAGDGTTLGSGGTIQNTVGADGAADGNGVYLNNTSNVSLNWMNFTGSQNNGVYGTGVRGFTLDQARFTGTTGTSNSGLYNESDVQLVNVGGSVGLTNSQFDGAAYNAVNITNTSGTAPALSPLVISNNKVFTMQGSTADVRSTALLVNLTDGSSDMQIDNNDVRFWWGNAIHVLMQGSASGTARITNNFADNTNGALAAAGGIWVVGGNLSYNISGNTVRHTNGTAISADRTNAGTLMQGTIEGNTIGVAGDNNSGSAAGAGIFASHHGTGTTTLAIRNNTIRQVTGQAAGVIRVLTGDATGFGGSGRLNATITGNDMQQTGSPSTSAHMAILATVGVQSGPPTDTDQVCLDIGGSTLALKNKISNINTGFGYAATSENRLRVNQRFGTTSRFPGYTGAQLGGTSQTDLAAYLLGRNTASNSTNANTSTGGFNNTVPAGSACPQPAM